MDWRGRYDGLAATYHEIGGASAVIGFILDPPAWFYPLAFFVGIILIWWNFQRNRERANGAIPQETSPRLALAFRSPDGKVRGWIGLLLLCVVLGGGYWYISSATQDKRMIVTVSIPTPRPVEAPVTQDSHQDSNPDITSLVVVPPTPPLEPLPSLPTQSRMNRFIFACDVPPPQTADEDARQKKVLQNNIQAWADTIGMSTSISDIRNGTQVTIEAKTNEAKTRFISMGLIPGITKVIFEVRSIERRLIVVIRADLPKNFRFFSQLLPDPSAQQIIDGQNLIPRFLGAPEGACRLI